MASAPKPQQRHRISPEKKQEVYQLLDEGLTAAEVSRRTGVPDMSVANLRKARKQQEAVEQEQSATEQLIAVQFELANFKLHNKYLRQYARAKTEVDKKDVEIAYLTARLTELFKDEWVRSLGEEDPDDGDSAT